MRPNGTVSTLVGQLAEAKARAEVALRDGRDARPIESISRSLRQSLAHSVEIRDPRDLVMSGFSLVVKPTGEPVVRHQDRELPVGRAFLEDLFREAGVVLKAGQTLVLDADLIRVLVEEALGALSREEARIRGAKSRLIRASLALLPPDDRGGSGPEAHSRHAA